MESCRGTLVPSVNSQPARLAPREFYSVAPSNLRDGLGRRAIHGGSAARPAARGSVRGATHSFWYSWYGRPSTPAPAFFRSPLRRAARQGDSLRRCAIHLARRGSAEPALKSFGAIPRNNWWRSFDSGEDDWPTQRRGSSYF